MNERLLRKILSMDQPTLLEFSYNLLKKKYGYKKIIKTEDYIMAAGDTPVALVAHLDTVFIRQPCDIFYDREECVMWSPDGLGADDRAGVYAIFQILETGLKPHIVFTTNEEKGCLGAIEIIKEHETFPFGKLKYIVQLDRQGADDSVFYNCNNPEFEKYINSYGFRKHIGSFSDISVLAPQWQAAAVNLSVGYIYEHEEIEHLYTVALEMTIGKVTQMLQEIDKAEYYEYIPAKTRGLRGSVGIIDLPPVEFTPGQCEWCGEKIEKPNDLGLCEDCYNIFIKY